MYRDGKSIYVKGRRLGERGDVRNAMRKNVKDLNALYENVRAEIINAPTEHLGGEPVFTAEQFAIMYGIKKHYVVQVFDRLVREGVLSKEINRPPHDCNRSRSLMDYGQDDSWVAKKWRRRK